MARRDIFKQIKDDVLIEDRIQIIRLHYNYLKTCLKHPEDFTISKSAYSKWDLGLVKRVAFDTWWKKVGNNAIGKKLTPPKVVRSNPKLKDNSLLIEVSTDAPTEYSVTKIRELLQSNKGKADDTDQRNHHLKLELYLEAWNLKRDLKMTLKEVRRRLVARRKVLLSQRMGKSFIAKKGKTVAMPREKVDNFLKYDPLNANGVRNLERQISRYKLNAYRILLNVSRGAFPGNYTS
jgi:hypothetical protein